MQVKMKAGALQLAAFSQLPEVKLWSMLRIHGASALLTLMLHAVKSMFACFHLTELMALRKNTSFITFSCYFKNELSKRLK